MVASFSMCGPTKFYLYLLSATNTLYNLQTALWAYNTFNDQNMGMFIAATINTFNDQNMHFPHKVMLTETRQGAGVSPLHGARLEVSHGMDGRAWNEKDNCWMVESRHFLKRLVTIFIA